MKGKRVVFILTAVWLAAFPVSAGIPERSLLDGVRPDARGRINVLVVFAHQDDESIYEGGTLLKLKKDPRVHLYLLCMTFDQTSEAKDNLGITPDHIGRIRVQELQTAAAVYEADEVIQFKYASRTLKDVEPEKLIGEIQAVMARTDAEIVITHDPAGLTGHQDHITCSKVTAAAFQRSSAQALYYFTLPRFWYGLILATNTRDPTPPPVYPDLKVDVRAEKKLKKMADFAHASQMIFSPVVHLAQFFLALDYEYFAVGGKK